MKTNYNKLLITLCLVFIQHLAGFSLSNNYRIMQMEDVNTIYDFKASIKNSTVELNWQTTTESNLSYYSVERSQDGVEWEYIGGDKAKGNALETTYYEFTDSIPLQGTQYYRLKQTDLNGNDSYSDIIYAAVHTDESLLVSLSPNPVTEYVLIRFSANSNSTSTSVRLLNSIGHLLKDSGPVFGNEVIMNVSDQPSDIYYIEVNNGETVKRVKFIKN